ncbi:MAG TPA: rod shape-determining protein [Herpetosiphonaceae bacterium]|nr:rod shape-determining protein [Herpetosiphonaceae bacterium]
MARKIGIDLGTANVLVYVKGKGIILSEPSVVALSTKDGRVRQVGSDALAMVGREPESIEVIRPMRNGVIADYIVTEAMLRHFIRRANRGAVTKPEVMICIPAGVTTVEMRAVRDAALQAGAKKAYLIREPLAAAIGANLPISQPSGNLIIDIGGGTAEVAVVSLNDIVVSTSVRVGGNKFDEAIASFIKRRYNLIVGERTAESIKIEIGTAVALDNPLTMQVRGRDQISGLPRTIELGSNDVAEALQEPLEAVINAVRAVLVETPPELASDIIDKGMLMTGGGSMLRRINDLLTSVTGVPCYVADQPANCVAIGTGIALENLSVLRDSLSGDDMQ